MAARHVPAIGDVAYYAYDFRRSNASGLVTYIRAMRDALGA